MKKLIVLIVLFITAQTSFAQRSFDGTADNLVIISGGVNQLIIYNPAFNAWAANNYNAQVRNGLSGEIDMALTFKSYDFGFDYTGNNPYGTVGGFVGKRLTSYSSGISSWLNVNVGNFFAYFHNLAPVDYKPTPDQVGQKLELHYYATYIGLTSRNYFNKAVIRIGKRKGVALTPSVYFSAEYEPFHDAAWKYGYNYTEPDDTSRHFKSVTINTIPKLNKFFFNAGITMGIAFKQK